MLVLQRECDEDVEITLPEGYVIPKGGLKVTVRLLEIRGPSRARLGFEGPREVTINRAEVQRRVDKKK